MSSTTNMVIVKNKPYSMTLIIKAIGASIPMVLDPLDTATLYINKLGKDGELYITKELSQGNPDNGEFLLNLTAAETELLPYDDGFKEDSSSFLPSCRGHVSTVTVENGNGEISIPEITVVNLGL